MSLIIKLGENRGEIYRNGILSKDSEFNVYQIEPTTIEPVKVKPTIKTFENMAITENACPNCNVWLLEKDKYCPCCGQALDWSE